MHRTGWRGPARQRGGMLSLLAVLLVIGLLAYFALRGYNGTQPAAAGAPQAACTLRVSDLVKRTGGSGSDYKAGYDALPPECQKFAPPPLATTERPDPDH